MNFLMNRGISMKKIIISTIVAASAMAFVGCDTMKETNSNKAVVVNNNAGANAANLANSNVMMNSNSMTMNSNTMSSSNSSWNANMTRADYDKDKDRYAADAKAAGSKIGTGANDGWLWTKTKAALATTAGLRDSTINVDVDNGVITLNGSVGTKEQQQMAVKVANEIEGKTSVKNNLTVKAGDSLTNQMTGGNTNTHAANANHK
jgi:osmotically-inducible protein OsmY